VGRPSKLTEERLELIRHAARLGLSEDECARAVGVCPATWYNWKARAQEIGQLLPAQWEALRFEQLREVALDLGLDPSTMRGSGKGGRLLRDDLVEVVRDRAGRYLEFLEELEHAAPASKLALLGRLDQLSRGGSKITTTTERTVRVYDEKGALKETMVISESKTAPMAPDRQSTVKMLEFRFFEEFGPRERNKKKGDDEVETARRIATAVGSMFASIEGPPEEKNITPEGGAAAPPRKRLKAGAG
jgi:hypothetical protein